MPGEICCHTSSSLHTFFQSEALWWQCLCLSLVGENVLQTTSDEKLELNCCRGCFLPVNVDIPFPFICFFSLFFFFLLNVPAPLAVCMLVLLKDEDVWCGISSSFFRTWNSAVIWRSCWSSIRSKSEGLFLLWLGVFLHSVSRWTWGMGCQLKSRHSLGQLCSVALAVRLHIGRNFSCTSFAFICLSSSLAPLTGPCFTGLSFFQTAQRHQQLCRFLPQLPNVHCLKGHPQWLMFHPWVGYPSLFSALVLIQ